MIITQLKRQQTVAVLDSAGQVLGVLICKLGKRIITKRVHQAIKEDHADGIILHQLTEKVVFSGNETKISFRIWDDKDDESPTDYLYYLKTVTNF